MNRIAYCLIISLLAFIHGLGQSFRSVRILVDESVRPRDTLLVYPEMNLKPGSVFLQIDSMSDGKWIGYYPDTNIAFKAFVRNGKQEGLFHVFFHNGKLYKVESFFNGKRSGPFSVFHEDGTLAEQGTYEDGILVREYNQYHPSGFRVRQKIFDPKGDEVKESSWYFNGNLKSEGSSSKGYRKGVWKTWHWNGKLESEKFYVLSFSHSDSMLIVSDSLAASKIPLLGFATGTWRQWDELGNLVQEQIFGQDYVLRCQKEYYPNGRLKKETYFQGWHPHLCSQNPGYFIREGEESEYYPSGKLKARGMYHENEKDGEWWYFGEDEKSQRVEKWDHGLRLE